VNFNRVNNNIVRPRVASRSIFSAMSTDSKSIENLEHAVDEDTLLVATASHKVLLRPEGSTLKIFK